MGTHSRKSRIPPARKAGWQDGRGRSVTVSEKAPGMAQSSLTGQGGVLQRKHRKRAQRPTQPPLPVPLQRQRTDTGSPSKKRNGTRRVEIRSPRAFHSRQTVTLNSRWQGQTLKSQHSNFTSRTAPKVEATTRTPSPMK